MAQLLIRGLDAEVVRRLKARAQEEGRSLQSEARLILEGAAKLDTAASRKRVDRIRRSLKGKTRGDSVELIREDRGR